MWLSTLLESRWFGVLTLVLVTRDLVEWAPAAVPRVVEIVSPGWLGSIGAVLLAIHITHALHNDGHPYSRLVRWVSRRVSLLSWRICGIPVRCIVTTRTEVRSHRLRWRPGQEHRLEIHPAPPAQVAVGLESETVAEFTLPSGYALDIRETMFNGWAWPDRMVHEHPISMEARLDQSLSTYSLTTKRRFEFFLSLTIFPRDPETEGDLFWQHVL